MMIYVVQKRNKEEGISWHQKKITPLSGLHGHMNGLVSPRRIVHDSPLEFGFHLFQLFVILSFLFKLCTQRRHF